MASFRKQTQNAAYQGRRDQGTIFEHLMVACFQTEPCYRELCQSVQPYDTWTAKYLNELSLGGATDAGIDLVATTFAGEHHATRCRNYAPGHTLQKKDIDSFFTTSGKMHFSGRIVIPAADKQLKNTEDTLERQYIPVSEIALSDLENSAIDWTQYHTDEPPKRKNRKSLRPHQQSALTAVSSDFARSKTCGKLIMACRTDRTFTSLRIAEYLVGKGKHVLFLIPNLSLLSQTLQEWMQGAGLPLRSFAVCFDSGVGKYKEDNDRIFVHPNDLNYPATTNTRSLYQAASVLRDAGHMTVVYSTYYSIDIIHQAQAQHGLPEFDLIICDETHHTAGATFNGDDESAFVHVHDAGYIKGAKRLYMTVTPRIYVDDVGAANSVSVCSMDDGTRYGEEFFVLTFSQAVSQKLLVNYKMIILVIDQAHVERRLQELLRDDAGSELKIDDAARIVGCWKALSKYGLSNEEGALYNPMRRAVAFCQVIEREYRGSRHGVSSKLIANEFSKVVKKYQQKETEEWLKDNPDPLTPPSLAMTCEAKHVDGGMNAGEKESRLQRLRADIPDSTCHILSNVRCLSEGVDVPALDTVLFLTPHNSKVDVVQSVGRIIRRAEGKK